jgi:hypothetical protein
MQEPIDPVTGAASGGSERGTGAPTSSTGTQGAVGAVLIVLALGFTLRLIIAYLIPGSGFDSDLASFRFWASNLALEGFFGFYERDFFHDYTPGYLYVLWVVGIVGQAVGGIGDLIKVPPILADLAIGYLAWSMVRELGGRERTALIAAAVAILNPISWFDSVVWGQVDSFGVVFLMLGLRSLWRDQPERAAIFTVIAAIIKPQLGILIPLVAVVTIRRALWPVAPAAPGASWEQRTGRPLRILTTGLAGYLTAVVICLPFGLSVLEPVATAPFIRSGLIEQIVLAGGGYPYLTVNAYNIWAIVPGDLGHSLANAGLWVCDAVIPQAERCGSGTAVFGVVPAVVVGALALIASIVAVLVVAARRPDRLTLLVALAVLALAFFAAPTRVHERYGFPFFALGAILFAISPRWRVAVTVASIATFLNMYVVLTVLYPPADPTLNPTRDWLGIGELIRSPISVTTLAVLHTVVLVWSLLQLRRSAAEQLEGELLAVSGEGEDEGQPTVDPGSVPDHPPDATAPETAGDARPAGATAMAVAGDLRRDEGLEPGERPGLSDVGLVAWLRDRVQTPALRPDRHRALVGEGGGRFDRLDVWLLLVLFVATLGMRTFRLAEPYQMHFDEVYHARTATEFLQGWRYGLSHDIYEWTHPHLAKYAMAGGLVVWGEDDVAATSDLGTPVRAAALEPRWDDPLQGGEAGGRVHLVTGELIRTEDLATRRTVGAIAAPGASAVAVDLVADRLVVGYEDGAVRTVDLTAIGLGGVDIGLQPVDLGAVDHPVERLLVTDDGATIVAAGADRVTTIDALSGAALGSLDLPGVVDLAPAGTGSALSAAPADITDLAAFADALAILTEGDAGAYLALLEGAPDPGTSVILGSPGDTETQTAINDAIGEGTLAGLEIVDLPRIAVATADGVTFIDPRTASVSDTLDLEGGAHGLARVTGIDDPRLYVSTGPPADPAYEVLTIGGDSAADGPRSLGRHPLPGPGTSVAYDEASQMVHVLGRTPTARDDGAGWTVYVIEPHANAVFADAVLPATMEPSAWVMDADDQYPSEDRQQLLVFGDDGQTAAIEVGSHAFAWRLPGVIAGALMAVFLYAIARILFRRRLVAGIVAGLVVLDGMLFVQSRIGMNDVYVGLLILAAYTVFAALWTGAWRGRGSFLIGLPIVGLLLGLALSAKWVAAYAIGALALLILVRSALGRTVAILGLIALTSVLGYMAISVPASETPATGIGGVLTSLLSGEALGNLTFLLIMIGLTLIAVVVAVVHPIAWTDEEQWLAIIAPAAIGAAVFFGSLALGVVDTEMTVGPLVLTPVHVAFALAVGSLLVYLAFLLGGRLGFGPMAAPPRPDSPASLLDPPAPPPEGWLRPGWAVGLPIVWAAVCLGAIPLVVYVISYIPWALIENHQLWPGVPAGHTGQTLLELTAQMYGYHNGLTSPHAASSPWWAWPFDLKPVWFYQDSFAGGTTAAIYNSGNLVLWWLGVPAMIFTAIMAYKRRSLALALIAVGFAAQWISWARIDRAAFQYHYYTALPFLILSLAYFLAELWHGASRRTWLAARVAAAAAIVAPAALWLLSRPLCWFVDVQSVNPGSQACPAVIPEAILTVRVLGLLVVVVVGAIVLGREVLALTREDAQHGDSHAVRRILIASVGVAFGFALAALLPDTAILTLSNVPVEPIAVLVGIPLSYIAAQVLGARDARRFVLGAFVAMAGWLVVVYPNIAALPLPSAVVNAYQGILPTYLYAFQFPVSTAERNVATPLLSPTLAILTIAIAVSCLVVAYSAWLWRIALAESAASTASSGAGAGMSDDPSDGLARTGEGA